MWEYDVGHVLEKEGDWADKVQCYSVWSLFLSVWF